jgi:hypothetical protein
VYNTIVLVHNCFKPVSNNFDQGVKRGYEHRVHILVEMKKGGAGAGAGAYTATLYGIVIG